MHICSVQFSHSVVSDSLWPHGLQHTRLLCPSPTSGVYSSSCLLSLLMPSNHLISCHLLLLQTSIFPSIKVFSNELALPIRWPKNKSISFSISPSNEYSELISFKIDWFYHLAVLGTLKSLLQYHNLKASIFQCSAFFMVQLSYLYMTTGKTIVLTVRNFVSKLESLLFNMFSRFVIAFLPRS